MKGRAHIVLPVGFVALVFGFILFSGAALASSATLLFLVGVPLVAVASAYRPSTKAWGAMVMVVLSYEALAGPVDAVADSSKLVSLFDLDRYIWGFNLTGWIQSTFSSASLTSVSYLLYELLVPFIALTSFVVWRYGRPNFGKFVTAVLLTSYAGLVTFLFVPTAPPWLVGAAENLVQHSGLGTATSYLGPLAPFFKPDYYAAFPSMHAAYMTICSYFLLKAGPKQGAAAVFLTGGVLFSTLYLGQHYLIDLIAGVAYALVPCLISERWQFV